MLLLLNGVNDEKQDGATSPLGEHEGEEERKGKVRDGSDEGVNFVHQYQVSIILFKSFSPVFVVKKLATRRLSKVSVRLDFGNAVSAPFNSGCPRVSMGVR